MTWTAKIRTANGTLQNIVLEAPTRAAAFADLKKRGLIALSLVEGGVVESPSPKGKSSRLLALVIGVLMLGLGLLAVKYFSAEDEQGTVTIKTGKQAQPPKTGSGSVKIVPSNAAPAPAKPKEKAPKPQPVAIEKTAPAGKVVAQVTAPAAVTNNLPEPEFRSGTEQVLRWIFTTEVGDMPPPLPSLPEDEKKRIVEILLDKNPVKEGDSEKTVQAKAVVRDAKHELAQFLKGGGKTEDFMAYYHNVLVDAHQKREEARQLVAQFAKEGDDKLTVEYVEKVNKELEKEGIRAVEVPRKVQKRLGLLEDNKERK